MGVSIRHATEADAPALGNINVAAFCHQEFSKNAFPGHEPAAILPLKIARALDKLADPTVHVLVAVDEDSPDKRVVGYSRWTIPDDPSPVTLSADGQETIARLTRGEIYPEGAKLEMVQEFLVMIKEKRAMYLRESEITLDFLGTLPEYQGRGVGSTLLRWGIEQAVKRQVGVFLEATMDGYSLYRKFGWQDLEEVNIEFSRWGGEGTQKFVLMRLDAPLLN
ncbi:acyl-CoA N-acyltransferase [Aspergillus taichungensis]|uniref:Acyl-CoA N-acyltransferase n=1 Tax=Aspergillus taichungensis TaxID=482145 RepID=A0A2J5I8I6_9EURO|nr:acyl-CoA N-acyltransferase [Aspergillus taichungensis]